MFPTNFGEWIALIAALVPVVIWAGSGLAKALTARAEQRSAEWRRLQELALLLYNGNHTFGGWAQQLAASELLDLAKHNRAARELATTIAEFWEPPHEDMPAAVRLAARLRGN